MRGSARANRTAARRGAQVRDRTTPGSPPWSAVTGPEPIIESMLEPPVRDEAPTDDAITDYDQMLFVTYISVMKERVFHGNVGFYATFPKCEFMLV